MEAVLRNSMGVFHETNVGLALEIDFAGHPAISAKITTLESVDPATLEAPEPADPVSPAPSGAASPRARIAGGIVAGFRTKFVEPIYPLQAKISRMSGSVFLRAVIGKDGSVQHLVPIASADPMFTDAAIEAVSKWMYRPYLLNGAPVEVDTTITVNFALR
jgi:TonB family protein